MKPVSFLKEEGIVEEHKTTVAVGKENLQNTGSKIQALKDDYYSWFIDHCWEEGYNPKYRGDAKRIADNIGAHYNKSQGKIIRDRVSFSILECDFDTYIRNKYGISSDEYLLLNGRLEFKHEFNVKGEYKPRNNKAQVILSNDNPMDSNLSDMDLDDFDL